MPLPLSVPARASEATVSAPPRVSVPVLATATAAPSASRLAAPRVRLLLALTLTERDASVPVADSASVPASTLVAPV